MEFRSATAAATLVIGALTASTGLANAEPVSQPNLVYSTKLVDKTVVTTLKGGTFALSKTPGSTPGEVVEVVDVRDGDGNVLLTLPLEFAVGPVAVPVQAVLEKDATVLALTPERPQGLTFDSPLTVKPVASQVENQRALNDFTMQFGLATTIGTFVGTAIGATVGCLATIVAGCVGGFMTGATVGGIIGNIVVGGPTLIASGIDLLTTMQAAEGTTRWADKPTQQPATTTAPPAGTQPAN
ncbi:hypothetical protein [Nocardia huaxiensis]|uniref:hypothetical protein n=1 Tax=Nocardia huaxiensis TaxID=2755382 RepID=UPI001FD5F10F|nr:hypothetical protein [Nocardia huaxiensis]